MDIEEIDKKLKEIDFEMFRAGSVWSRNLTDKKKAGLSKAVAGKGEQTSLQKDLRRMKARMLTIKNEKLREIDNGK